MSTVRHGAEHRKQFYIDGRWVSPSTTLLADVRSPVTEELIDHIALGGEADVQAAAFAARRAFVEFGTSTVASRRALLERILVEYDARASDLADLVSLEMGAPVAFAKTTHVGLAREHFQNAIDVLDSFEWEYNLGTSRVVREPIGVCGLITAWNWPLMLITSKLAYGLAAGCTIVLKPSEVTPLSAIVLAEILHEAGTPAGVFNLVNGDGPTVGQALSSHPEVDMISFTGSTQAGVLVAQAAAPTIKRVHQELGGKSANIILPDAELQDAIPAGVLRGFTNSGQACIAPTRMLVHESQLAETVELARGAVESIVTGPPDLEGVRLGPLVNAAQFERVQGFIRSGVSEGARLVAGGLGRPEGLDRGYFVRPTVFADVAPGMTIAREEIFGPVLSILTYDTEETAIRMANDSQYGLGSYVHSSNVEHARAVARKLRSGRAYINLALSDTVSPFGGYRQSGNGRENGAAGFEEYLETKSILGYQDA